MWSSWSCDLCALRVAALTILLLYLTGHVTSCPYNNPQHTLCRFQPGACPGKTLLRSGGLDCSEKQVILDTHNQLRQSVALGHVSNQPPAAGMREMVWDEELATVAQRWADQCRSGHDSARTVSRFPVGQNVAVTWTHSSPSPAGAGPEFRRQIEAWFSEVMRFGLRRDDIEHFHFSERTGHYSQLVWSDTYLVGCGYSYYLDPQRGYTKLYVCNYGPGGNVVGAHLYEAGTPTCTHGNRLSRSKRYTGLCEVQGSDPPGMICGARDVLKYASQPSPLQHVSASPVYPPPTPSHPRYLQPSNHVDQYTPSSSSQQQYSSARRYNGAQYSTTFRDPFNYRQARGGGFSTAIQNYYGK